MISRFLSYYLKCIALVLVLSSVVWGAPVMIIDKYVSELNIVDTLYRAQRSGNVIDTLRPRVANAAITYQSAGALNYSSSVNNVFPAYPASIAAGDLLIVLVGQKPSTANSGSVATPNGWTAITSLTGAGGYGATLGTDTGNTNIFAFYKVAEGTETTSDRLVLKPSTSNVAWAQMYRLTNATEDWSVAGTTGSDASGDASVSIAMSADPGTASGDFILGAMVIPTDVSTPSQFSAQAFSQSGVTFGTVTEISEPDTTTGNDMGGFVVRSSISSGTSSGAPTMTATAGGTVTNVRGPGIFIRVRATGTITYQSAGALAYSTSASNVGPDYPSSPASGDLLVLLAGQKPSTANSGTATTPPGWTFLREAKGLGGYSTTLAADTGNTNVYSYYKVSDGSEETSQNLTIGTNSVTWAQIYRISSDSDTWSLAAVTSEDTSGDASVSLATSTDPGVLGNDFILGGMVIPTDITTPSQFSAQALSQSGITFGTVTEVSEPDSGNGNDIGGFVIRAPVSSGTSAGGPTITATAGGTVTNVRGPGIFIRVREVLPTYVQQAYRFFNNNNSADVGSALANQDTAATLANAGDAFRLRMLLRVDTANLHASGQDFKLQFATKSGTCDTGFSGESYADVTAGTAIAFNNNASPADGDNLTANANDPTDGGRTIVNQDYEEANNFTNTVSVITAGQDGKWDFSLIDNGAPSGTSYCFRVVKADGSTLDTYTSIPEIATASGASLTFVVSHDNFLDLSPGTPVFATTTLSVDYSGGTGWYVTLSGDDQSPSDTVMDLSTDAAVGITDQLEWIPGSATTSPGNAVRLSSLDNSGDVLAFRVMSASGSVAFRAATWWGSADTYTDNANTLWAGIASSTIQRRIGNSSVSSGGGPALSTVLYYLDVPITQQTGTYTGGVTYTATANP